MKLQKGVKIVGTLLVSHLVIFYLYTSANMMVFKHYYIRRYVEIVYKHNQHRNSPPLATSDVARDNATLANRSFPLPNGEHKIVDVDEEFDAFNNKHSSDNHTNPFADQGELTPFMVSSGDDDEPDRPDNGVHHSNIDLSAETLTEIGHITMAIVATVLLVEFVYLAIYIYIVCQQRFCPMLIFAILTVLSTLFHLQNMFIEVDNDDNQSAIGFKHMDHHHQVKFVYHVNQMDAQATIDHLAQSDHFEAIFAFTQTLLALGYTVLLKIKDRKSRRSRASPPRYIHFAVNGNGHVPRSARSDSTEELNQPNQRDEAEASDGGINIEMQPMRPNTDNQSTDGETEEPNHNQSTSSNHIDVRQSTSHLNEGNSFNTEPSRQIAVRAGSLEYACRNVPISNGMAPIQTIC